MPGLTLSARERKRVRGLQRRKHREQERRFLVEGVRAVEDLLASALAVELVAAASTVEDTARGRALLAQVERCGLPLRRLSDAELAELATTEAPQGVLAVAVTPDAALADLDLGGERAVLLVLDAVQDPGNYGTLVRTAEALGAAAVVSLPGTVEAWNPKAVRAAMGSSFRLPVIEAGWAELAPWLARHGVRVLAAAGGGAPLSAPPRRAALVVGNEGAGISPATRSHADAVVGIPLRGRAESLNVAAAAAILLHELLR